ncbi:MAG: pyridine nucleotide-disulfide oxidoreductase [Pseudonocardia sp.]|nr:MAG: pyridine nucleotide-disulfide oxidoreductase [Pseudonocardia sp.]
MSIHHNDPDSVVVIVGASHAGVQAADSLLAEGFTGRIEIFSDEAELPYQKPPLSKNLDAAPLSPLPLRAESFFEDPRITLHRGARVATIDRATQVVETTDGTRVRYAALILATGTRPRTLPLPGHTSPGIHALRTVRDATDVAEAMPHSDSAVVIGAGFIGLEFATVARRSGIDVAILALEDRPMSRVVSPIMSSYFAHKHSGAGVQLRMGEAPESFLFEQGILSGVRGSSGTVYSANLALVGIGVVPNDELAASCGLNVNNGIVVDEFLRTSDPAIYAIGDCANFPSLDGSLSRRVESVQNANDQARAVARNIAGVPSPYQEVPWFWSVQAGVRLQIAGLAEGVVTTITSGETESDSFSTLSFDQSGRLIAVESVNRSADHLAARRLLKGGCGLTPEQASAPGFNLKHYSQSRISVL